MWSIMWGIHELESIHAELALWQIVKEDLSAPQNPSEKKQE
jgi:hypothetical protein